MGCLGGLVVMRRGEIRENDLEPVRGSEANKRRPAVIVSNDADDEDRRPRVRQHLAGPAPFEVAPWRWATRSTAVVKHVR